MVPITNELRPHPHKSKIIPIVIVTVILLLGITALIFFSDQFVGQAILSEVTDLQSNQAGIPLYAEDPFTIQGTLEPFDVFVNLGDDDGLVFQFVLDYNSQNFEYKGIDFNSEYYFMVGEAAAGKLTVTGAFITQGGPYVGKNGMADDNKAQPEVGFGKENVIKLVSVNFLTLAEDLPANTHLTFSEFHILDLDGNDIINNNVVNPLFSVNSQDDPDGDGVLSAQDNCPYVANADQEKSDPNDNSGDACDPDDDGDGILDENDLCPKTYNPEPVDTDGDGTPNACDLDDDNDGLLDAADNCPLISNPTQKDSNGDGKGDACEADQDGDKIPDWLDNCATIPNADQENGDGDAQGNACDLDDDNDSVLDTVDNCPIFTNKDQLDTDGDKLGNACDSDDDNDGVLDCGVGGNCANTLDNDNCPLDVNPDQLDSDNDGLGDVCDTPDDSDGDGINNLLDNCKLEFNPDQTDTDGDTLGDVCDKLPCSENSIDAYNTEFVNNACKCIGNFENIDGSWANGCELESDNDGVAYADDNCPLVANADQLDSDGDGIGNVCDPDDDNDSLLDTEDNCPLIPNDKCSGDLCALLGLPEGQAMAWEDSDQDGIGNVCDDDSDNDGILDDGDNSGVIGDNLCKVGVENCDDNCKKVANSDQANHDKDSMGDACDPDDDNDGVFDNKDSAPLDATIGGAPSSDGDGDGVINQLDVCPQTPAGKKVVNALGVAHQGCMYGDFNHDDKVTADDLKKLIEFDQFLWDWIGFDYSGYMSGFTENAEGLVPYEK